MASLKLSQLDDAVEISLEESNTIYTVGELKREITELNTEEHSNGQWFTVIRTKWEPCALTMVTQYIENQEDDMYEEWSKQAIEQISSETIKQIQKLLNESFKDSSVNDVWIYDIPVEIDVFHKED